jgi:hypothetical protein
MLELCAFTLSLVAFCAGCASLSTPAAGARPPLRLLSSEAATAPRPETLPSETESGDAATPRIGAPGGSGAGSRRVVPVQSGKETVGGLPAGIGGCTGPAGRG